jgi:hypothetical protein
MNVSTRFRADVRSGSTKSLRQWQIQVFAVSWITYAAFYFPRSAFSAAKVGILEDPAVNTVLTKPMLAISTPSTWRPTRWGRSSGARSPSVGAPGSW